MLLQPSGDDFAGKYKTEDNFIMETDRESVRSVRFTPVPANETASAMEQLILAYHAAYSESEINPLLLIPCVILDFLCIHPFRDGNGRMSRLLSLLLLYRLANACLSSSIEALSRRFSLWRKPFLLPPFLTRYSSKHSD